MNGKLVILAVGVGIGFLLGSRAGRGPYEKVAKCTKEFWEDPRVQHQVDRSVAFANDKLEDLAEIVSTGTWTQPYMAQQGDRISADFGPLGIVEVEIT